MEYVKRGVGKQQRVGVGQTDILGGHYGQTTGYEFGVLATLYHARQPVYGRIRVTAAYALDKSRYYIVVYLSVLVVGGGILLEACRHHLVVDYDRLVEGSRLLKQVEDIEQLAGVASGVAKQGRGRLDPDFAPGKHLVGRKGLGQEGVAAAAPQADAECTPGRATVAGVSLQTTDSP